MKNLKKFASLFLALAMCLSLLPATALAADGSGLQDLIDQASVGSTVTLTQNYTLTAPVTVNKAVTIDGGMHTVTAASNQNALNVTASGVTVKNLEIVTAVRGINFYPANGQGATLTVTGTTIRNSNVSDYNTTADYGADNRGIATGDVKGGRITITNCKILGFKYSINAVVTPDGTGLRNGNGTTFNVTNTTIKGWTALNMWSANTKFNFTNCTLVGINTLGGTSNSFATIEANSGIYGGKTNMSSTVTVTGGSLTAVRYGEAGEAIISVDHELQTKFKFNKSSGTGAVRLNYYGKENVAGGPVYLNIWNFDYLNVGYEDPNAAADAYMASHVEGYETATVIGGGTLEQYAVGVSQNSAAIPMLMAAIPEYKAKSTFIKDYEDGGNL